MNIKTYNTAHDISRLFLYFTEWKYDLKVQTDTIYVIGVLVGFGGSAMLITSLSITAELVGDNVESSAFIYGAMSFTDKLSTGKNNPHKHNHDKIIVNGICNHGLKHELSNLELI